MKTNTLFTNTRFTFLIFSILSFVLVLDISINRINIISPLLSYENNELVFLFLLIVYSILIFFVFRNIEKNNPTIFRIKHIKVIHYVIKICQPIILLFLFEILFSLLFFSKYDLRFVFYAVNTAYFISLILASYIALRLFQWYLRSNKKIILLFMVTSITLTLNFFFSILIANFFFINKPDVIEEGTGSTTFIFNSDFKIFVKNFYFIISIISFLINWFTAFILLFNYSKKKKINFIVMTLSLAYFILQFLPLSPKILEILNLNNMNFFLVYNLFFGLSGLVGGVLFGSSLFLFYRKIIDKRIKFHITLVSFGLIMLFISNHIIFLAYTQYPPFASIAISSISLSSYLFMLGIYSITISLSQDMKLRKIVRDVIVSKYDFFSTLANAEMIKNIEKITSKQFEKDSEYMYDETGIRSYLTQEELKKYVKNVMDELEKIKNNQK